MRVSERASERGCVHKREERDGEKTRQRERDVKQFAFSLVDKRL